MIVLLFFERLTMKSSRQIVYLTFDIDWAHDDVIAHMLDVIETENVPATIFVTHDTPLLARMRANPNIELGAHPNFIPLELGNSDISQFGDYTSHILQFYRTLLPEATTVRSHGLVQSTRLLDLMTDMGFSRESNLLITLQSGMNLRAFYHWTGIMRVPYFWEDDIHCAEIERNYWDGWDVSPFLDNTCLKVFDFHPIHLFLNTNKMSLYESARPFFHQPQELDRIANETAPGDRDFLIDLIAGARARNYDFGLLRNIYPD